MEALLRNLYFIVKSAFKKHRNPHILYDHRQDIALASKQVAHTGSISNNEDV